MLTLQTVLLGAIGAVAIIFIVVIVIAAVKGSIRPLGGIIAVLCFAGAMAVCVFASSGAMLLSRPAGDPGTTVERFFSSIVSGNYETAYTCLDGYSTLGLENEASTEAGKLMQDALRQSYAYPDTGKCMVMDGLTAEETVQFSYLDIAAIRRDASDRVNAVLEEMTEDLDREEVYDENDNYLPELVEDAYLAAVREILDDSGDYTRTADITVNLEYKSGKWMIVPDALLLSCIMGGTM